MKYKKLKLVLGGLIGVYLISCTVLYFLQERLIFQSTKLPSNFEFPFEQDFEEINLKTTDGINLTSLLFHSEEKKGIVLVCHGTAGALHTWAVRAPLFLKQGYDVLYYDYRGYGKSQGEIQSEEQLIQDAQLFYDLLKKKYGEDQLLVYGTSIGTGIATKLTEKNDPKHLILQSPYYSLTSLIREKLPFIPSFIIKYPLKNHESIQKTTCPITVFHGALDYTIPKNHSHRLKEVNPNIHLHSLNYYGHNDLRFSKGYLTVMKEVLH